MLEKANREDHSDRITFRKMADYEKLVQTDKEEQARFLRKYRDECVNTLRGLDQELKLLGCINSWNLNEWVSEKEHAAAMVANRHFISEGAHRSFYFSYGHVKFLAMRMLMSHKIVKRAQTLFNNFSAVSENGFRKIQFSGVPPFELNPKHGQPWSTVILRLNLIENDELREIVTMHLEANEKKVILDLKKEGSLRPQFINRCLDSIEVWYAEDGDDCADEKNDSDDGSNSTKAPSDLISNLSNTSDIPKKLPRPKISSASRRTKTTTSSNVVQKEVVVPLKGRSATKNRASASPTKKVMQTKKSEKGKLSAPKKKLSPVANGNPKDDLAAKSRAHQRHTYALTEVPDSDLRPASNIWNYLKLPPGWCTGVLVYNTSTIREYRRSGDVARKKKPERYTKFSEWIAVLKKLKQYQSLVEAVKKCMEQLPKEKTKQWPKGDPAREVVASSYACEQTDEAWRSTRGRRRKYAGRIQNSEQIFAGTDGFVVGNTLSANILGSELEKLCDQAALE